MEQKGMEPIRDAKSLGKGRMLILGLQHMFAMFGATVLVPILVGGYFKDATGEPVTRGLTVAVTLFCAGFGTIIFHICSKFKVPAFLGSSFAFLGGFYTVANLNMGKFASMGANDKAAYACGGVVIAGCLYFVLAIIIKLVGIHKVMRFLPPIVTGPIIICIGLSLAGSAISNASANWLLAFIALAVIIVFNIWGKGMFKIIPILMGVAISYFVAVVFNAFGMTNPDGSALIDFSAVADASFVGIPMFQICKFDITAILVMAPIAIASMMEHIGDMSAISATVGENFIESPGLHRTLTGDGLATAFAGLLGGPANTTYGENTGVLELSRVYDPVVIRIAAVMAIILSFVPKFSAIISTMPTAIIGGISFMLYGMISAIGVRNIVENRVDLTKSRNLIIAGVIFVCGLGFSDGLTFNMGTTSVTLTALAIAAIAGIILNAVLPGNDYKFGENPKGDHSHGVFITSSDGKADDSDKKDNK
ncbi:MAG: uracil-xanthine permease [Lachnospiraceae bacterium]|nr:uracil-xanthine permease [Lachnospiraceae bacterium]